MRLPITSSQLLLCTHHPNVAADAAATAQMGPQQGMHAACACTWSCENRVL